MYAAVLHEYGAPRFDRFDEPQLTGDAVVVNVTAAALSQFDVVHASGQHVIKPPILPAVAGNEGIGRLEDGRRVYFAGALPPYGSMAERTLVRSSNLIDVPDGVDDAAAAALGNSGLAAWLPLSLRAQLVPGESVLVIGATGIVGRLAVQAAKLLGASRVIAAGRDPAALERVRELGANAVVALREDSDMTGAYASSVGAPVNVIVDYVWGRALEAALHTAETGARIVQVGRAAASGDMQLSADLMRAKSLNVLGYATYHVPHEVRAAAYQRLANLAADGRLLVDLECLPLSEVEQAWPRQRAGVRSRLVLMPGQ
jgi:NADPH2:quinone reductase